MENKSILDLVLGLSDKELIMLVPSLSSLCLMITLDIQLRKEEKFKNLKFTN